MTAAGEKQNGVPNTTLTGMLGVAVVEHVGFDPDRAYDFGRGLNALLQCGGAWASDPEDPRGVALRTYVSRLAALVNPGREEI